MHIEEQILSADTVNNASSFRAKHNGTVDHEIAAAIELAVGLSLPNEYENWPAGLVCAWNEAVDLKYISDRCKTVGAMARAFLQSRTGRLLDRQPRR